MSKAAKAQPKPVRNVVSVDCVDQLGILAAICQAIAAAGADIRAMSLAVVPNTGRGLARFEFKAGSVDLDKLKRAIRSIKDCRVLPFLLPVARAAKKQEGVGRLSVARRRLEQGSPPEVRIWVQCVDKLGRLASICEVIAEAGVDIRAGDVSTDAKTGQGFSRFDLRTSPAQLDELVTSINALDGIDRVFRVQEVPVAGRKSRGGEVVGSVARGEKEATQFVSSSQSIKERAKTPLHVAGGRVYNLDASGRATDNSWTWQELDEGIEKLNRQFAQTDSGVVPGGAPQAQNTPPAFPGRKPISYPPGPPGLPKKERSRILRAVKRDHNFSRVAREFGVSDMTVSRIAKHNGIGPGQHSGTRISDEKRAKVLEALKHARSFRAAAAEVGDINHKTVAKIAKEEAENQSRIGAAVSDGTKHSYRQGQVAESRRLKMG